MSDLTEPAVSTVTSFYHTADYPAECIVGVLAQTVQNWEYVLVNNCSTDRCARGAAELCLDLAAEPEGEDQRLGHLYPRVGWAVRGADPGSAGVRMRAFISEELSSAATR